MNMFVESRLLVTRVGYPMLPSTAAQISTQTLHHVKPSLLFQLTNTQEHPYILRFLPESIWMVWHVFGGMQTSRIQGG